MRADTFALVSELYKCWAIKDLPAVLDLMSDDVTFVMHIPAEEAPFAGETSNKDDLVPRLQLIIEEFEFIEYRPLLIRDDDHDFRAQILYHYRHKATGREIEGSMRHVGRVADGKIARLEEFHDTQRVLAFLELIGEETSGKPPREFPNIKKNR
jgi:ketosteroid isomerase-like protein